MVAILYGDIKSIHSTNTSQCPSSQIKGNFFLRGQKTEVLSEPVKTILNFNQGLFVRCQCKPFLIDKMLAFYFSLGQDHFHYALYNAFKLNQSTDSTEKR